MTEAVEARSTTTTMVIEGKNGDAGSLSVRGSKKTFTDDLHSTFSSPLAWILVLALVITWSCVFVIMFDLMDYKTVSGGLSKIGSDPLKAVNNVVEESTNVISVILKFAANLIAPDEDEGNLYAVRKKGEFLPSRSKGLYLLFIIFKLDCLQTGRLNANFLFSESYFSAVFLARDRLRVNANASPYLLDV
ncbi:triadin-like isoform X3 [Morone saxatilis]|uniref:triadin-like isoform X3 n=1 Tax=Morone saxatilis TaxID=34816 RepID=UPI0015E1F0B1|nr:triadin-like isoform X3 [Morone saxatilis]